MTAKTTKTKWASITKRLAWADGPLEIAAEWIKTARDKAKAAMREETDEHRAFIWGHFREQVGVKP
jgi:hypothetical protein